MTPMTAPEIITIMATVLVAVLGWAFGKLARARAVIAEQFQAIERLDQMHSGRGAEISRLVDLNVGLREALQHAVDELSDLRAAEAQRQAQHIIACAAPARARAAKGKS